MRIIFTIILLFTFLLSKAQIEYQYSLHKSNYSIYNPAATGISNKHLVSINSLHNFPNNENRLWVFNSALYNIKLDSINSGIGINFQYFQYANVKGSNVNLNYAYQYRFKNRSLLSAGIAALWKRESFSFYDGFPDRHIVDINSVDTIVIKNYFDFNLGIIYKTERLLVGLSTVQLAETQNFARHYYFKCTFNMPVGKHIDLTPGLFLSVGNYDRFEMNLTTTLFKQYWLGITYSPPRQIRYNYRPLTYRFMGGIDFRKRIRLGYTYVYKKTKYTDDIYFAHEIVMAVVLD